MMKLWLTVLALFALVLAQPESDTEGWSTLNLEGGMVLSWLVNGDSVSFSILAPT